MDLLELVHDYSTTRGYGCTYRKCVKAFARRSDLVRHMRIHTNERPYLCSWPGCQRDFIQRSALTVHFRVHTGERPHHCEAKGCDKAFSDSSSLARHRRIHTGNRPYQCHIRSCLKTFCRKMTLTRHLKRNHLHEPGYQPDNTGPDAAPDFFASTGSSPSPEYAEPGQSYFSHHLATPAFHSRTHSDWGARDERHSGVTYFPPSADGMCTDPDCHLSEHGAFIGTSEGLQHHPFYLPPPVSSSGSTPYLASPASLHDHPRFHHSITEPPPSTQCAHPSPDNYVTSPVLAPRRAASASAADLRHGAITIGLGIDLPSDEFVGAAPRPQERRATSAGLTDTFLRARTSSITEPREGSGTVREDSPRRSFSPDLVTLNIEKMEDEAELF